MNTETTQSDAPIRVMLVEDERVLRSMARCALDGKGGLAVVAELSTGEDAYEQYADLQPDIVLMDIHMPGAGGIVATRRIVAADTAARVVMWSSDTSEAMVRQALDAGAVGFVDKLGPCEDLGRAARHVRLGKSFFSPGILPSDCSKSGRQGQSSPVRVRGRPTPRCEAA